jgi:two-component system cell cycle sensor histidine kinase/response regulator CckA
MGDRREPQSTSSDETARQFETLVTHVVDGVLVVDKDGTVCFANPAAEVVLARAGTELVGTNLGQPVVVGESTEITVVRENGLHATVEMRATGITWDGAPAMLASLRDISELRRQQVAREVSEARLAHAQRVAKLGHWEWDLRRQELTWSDEIYRIFELDPSAPLSFDGVSSLIHPEDRAQNQAFVDNLYAGGERAAFQFRLLLPDGRVKHILQFAEVHLDDAGRPDFVVGTMHDETARRQAEHDLRISETRYRRLFESAKDGILILDADSGKIVDVNPYLLDLLGFSREHFLGKKLWEIGPFSDIAPSEAAFEVLLTEKYVRYDDLPLQARDGRRIPVEFVSNVYRVDRQSVIQCNIRDITERKRAEASLREQEESYRTLFNSAGDAIFIREPSGRFLDANDVACERLGYSRAELLAMTPRGFDDPADDATLDRRTEVVQRDGKGIFEVTHIARDGRRIPTEICSRLIRYKGQQAILSVGRDITERKQAGQALQESKQLVETIVENVPHMIFLKEAQDLRFVLFNRAGEDLLGYDRKDLLGKNDLDLFPPEQAARFMATDREVLATDALVDIPEEPILAAKGTRLLHTRKLCIKAADGVTKYLLGISEDITERRRAVETLAASEARYRSYVDATGQVGWVTNADGEVVEDVPSLRRFTGQTYEEIRGLGWTKAVHPDDLERTLQVWNSAVAAKSAYEAEYRMRRYDGVYRHLLARGFPVCRADGSVREWVGTCLDITERKRLETEREKLEEQLRMSQKMESIGQLAGGVAHDFNNLLTVILSYTNFAMDALRDGDPLKDDLSEVKMAGDRAVVLTRQLLAFSRKQILQPEPLDLNQTAAGVEKMLRRILGEDIDFVQKLAPGLGIVRADPGQMEQVLMNLVVNARDAMPEGGKLTMETSNVEFDQEYAARHVAVTPGPYVQISVTDTGCGMDDRTKARIFEPFFTTKEKGKGTGLGLSTVYGIVKQSGGNIWVYSEPGLGTTFKIYLPCDLSATTSPAAPPSTAYAPPKVTETILVVEDEESLRRVAERSLAAAGYRVLTAVDGDDALVTSERYLGEIHLVLTDVVMPRMGGRILAQELMKARPPIKVLYMSGHTDSAIVHHGLLDTGTHFLAKPFTSVSLTKKVREVLDEGVSLSRR